MLTPGWRRMCITAYRNPAPGSGRSNSDGDTVVNDGTAKN
jgi:hypothetical protein